MASVPSASSVSMEDGEIVPIAEWDFDEIDGGIDMPPFSFS